MKLITVPIDDEVDGRLRAAAAAECRTLRWQAAAELRRALGLSLGEAVVPPTEGVKNHTKTT